MNLSTKLSTLLALAALAGASEWKREKIGEHTYAVSDDARPLAVGVMSHVIPGGEVFRLIYRDGFVGEGHLEVVYYCGMDGDCALFRSIRMMNGKELALDLRIPRNSKGSFLVGCALTYGAVGIQLTPTEGMGAGMTAELARP